ncbi:MAG: GNAT family N-acetyltransferase [Pseudomonadota bacterium]
MPPLAARTVAPSDLSHEETAAWEAIAAAHPAFGNPLLGPAFAREVGAVRADARVTVYRRGERVVGFLAHHRRPGGLGRPLAAPLSDYHGLVGVADAGIEGPRALDLAGLSAYRFTGLVDPHGVFAGVGGDGAPAYAVRFDGSAEDYLEGLRAASPKRFKNWRRLDHRLGREVGEIRLEASRDPAVLHRLLDWKRAQFARTGVTDFLREGWTRALLERLADLDGPLRGLTVALWAGDTLAAGHFGVARNGWYHPWIASTNPDLAEHSPGQIFLTRAIAAMPALGLTTYDLGPSHDHYKRHYAAPLVMVGEGTAAASNPAGALAGGRERLWVAAGARRPGMVGRLRRRMDAIATLELTAAGRLRGFADAVAALPRRHAGGECD